jgi:16S rRNA (guanine527-N7)-methyltransferase
MTEDEARAWLLEGYGAARVSRLTAYVELLMAGAVEQNLIAATTIDQLWARHIVDSAQLAQLGDSAGLWADVGSGAGLPGIVVALLTDAPMLLIEPRRLRVAFLQRCIDALDLAHQVTIAPVKSQRATVRSPVSVITARAVAPLPELFAGAAHLAGDSTLWLLPKGRSARSEVAEAQRAWQGMFHVKPSITDPEAGIVVARGVRRR